MTRLEAVVVVDNEASNGLRSEWGWSIYVRAWGRGMLFDAGGSPETLRHNLSLLGIDPASIDYVVLSHHHGDHSGGLRYIGEVRRGVRVYVPPDNTSYLRDWGLDPVVVRESTRIHDGVWVIGPLGRGLFTGLYEIAVAIETPRGAFIVVGCSHPGIERIVDEALGALGGEAYMVIGGFHTASRHSIDAIARVSKYIAPAHCTSRSIREYARRRYPEKYVDVKAGFRIVL